jgi:hypothetical protein
MNVAPARHARRSALGRELCVISFAPQVGSDHVCAVKGAAREACSRSDRRAGASTWQTPGCSGPGRAAAPRETRRLGARAAPAARGAASPRAAQPLGELREPRALRVADDPIAQRPRLHKGHLAGEPERRYSSQQGQGVGSASTKCFTPYCGFCAGTTRWSHGLPPPGARARGSGGRGPGRRRRRGARPP